MRTSAWIGLSLLLAACSSTPTSNPAVVADAGAPDASQDAEPPTPPINWGSCPAQFRDECATIQVPLDHDKPGETIDLFISRRGTGRKQLWLLQGGPGASAEAFFGLHDFLSALDPDLQVYTIEHRGVGASTRLGCAAEKGGTPGGTQIALNEWPDCQAEVVSKWGKRLDLFSTTQAAHDLAWAIARTRDKDQKVFVYGGSYGTFWANRFGVLHPKSADGIVLDAPVQPGVTLQNYDLAFEPLGRKVFSELCPQVPKCAARLGADPLAVLDRTAQALRGGHCSSVGVDFETWRWIFGVAVMDYALRNWLPAIIYRLDRCSADDQRALSTMLSKVFRGGGGVPRMSKILQAHVLLSELWPRRADPTEVSNARMNALFFQDAVDHVYAVQDSWPRYAPDPMSASYIPPGVPVLTLAGALDPAAPPAAVGYGYRDNLRGPHQTFVEIPYGAHTVLRTGFLPDGEPTCPVQLVRAFFADPTSSLPVACASRVLKPTLDAPRDVAMNFFGSPDIYD
jgi:pimeloyl-ACP methyl ester carboxylesterase